MNADLRSLEDDLLTPPAHRALCTGRRLSTRRKPEEKEKETRGQVRGRGLTCGEVAQYVRVCTAVY